MKIKETNWKQVKKDFKQQNKTLKRWLEKNYGKRCRDYCKECILCTKWRLFDKLKLSEDKK